MHRISTPTTWNLNNATLINGEAFAQVDGVGSFASISQIPLGGYTPGNTYRVTFDAWGTAANDIRVQSDPSGGIGGLSNANALFQPTTSYLPYEFIWTANANCTSIAFERNDANQVSWDFYIDNVSVQEVTTANWFHDTSWEKVGVGAGAFGHIAGTTGYLEQNLIMPLVEGQQYNITMDVLSGTGPIYLVNTAQAPASADVEITISGGTGTAMWTQGSFNNNLLRIYQAGGDRVIDNVSIVDPSTAQTLFFMFRKPVEQNVSSLKGYYAETTFTNSSTEKQELFTVGSEITISSK